MGMDYSLLCQRHAMGVSLVILAHNAAANLARGLFSRLSGLTLVSFRDRAIDG